MEEEKSAFDEEPPYKYTQQLNTALEMGYKKEEMIKLLDKFDGNLELALSDMKI